MNLGRGFSVPQDKRITQNNTIWIPATPEKPVVQRPAYARAEMRQNPTGPENWQDLLGIYTGLLQDDGLPQNFHPAVFQGQYRNNIQEIVSVRPPPQNFHPNIVQGQNRNKIQEIVSVRPPPQNFHPNIVQGQNRNNIQEIVSVRPPPQNFHPNIVQGQYRNNIQEIVSVRPLPQNFHPNIIQGQNRNNFQDIVPVPPLPQNFDLNALVDLNSGEKSFPVQTYNGHFHNFSSIGLLGRNHDETVQSQLTNLNQNVGGTSSYMQNSGNVIPPRKVDSLADLMSTRGSSVHLTNGGANRCNYVGENPVIIRPYSEVDIIQSTQKSAYDNIVGYNLQQMPNSKLSVPYRPSYNLNLPPRSEGAESSNVAWPFQFGPVIPDKKEKPKDSQIIQVPHWLIEEISTQERVDRQEKGISSQQTEIVERKNEGSVQKNGETNISEGGIDLNKTPQQKTPKRRKHRPKVVVEGKKPKRTPKPKNNTPEGNSTGKRKYVRKKITETSKTPPADEVQVLNNVPAKKTCRRALDFDLENEVQNQSHGKEFDYLDGVKVPFDKNSDSNGVERSKDQDVNGKAKQAVENLYDFTFSVKQVPSHESLPTMVKENKLNVIARNLSMRNANLSGALAKPVIQAHEPNLIIQNKPQILKNLLEMSDRQGTMGEYSHATQTRPVGPMGSGLWFGEVSKTGPNKDLHNNFDSESNKRKKVEENFNGTSSSMASGITTVENCSKGEAQLSQQNEITISPVDVSRKKQTPSPKKSRGSKRSSKKVIGSTEEKKNLFSVDYVTDRMKSLQIVQEEGSAIVPFRGGGVIVPYEPLVNKRKPRPKVDLDPETNRLWNLLMYKEGSESAEAMDINKQKWWEEERKVFRGRVDSFIARMHLVQGDRRFSRWKGSVVDSVIGVFLTQNVSDHLSSSAYMSLAAKFPLKTPINESWPQTREGSSSEVRITFPDDDHKVINNQTRRTEEDLISSQSSSESFIFQATTEEIRSSSGSNSEVEDQTIGPNLNKKSDSLSFSEQSNSCQFQVQGSPFQNPAQGQYPTGRNAYSDLLNSNLPHHQGPISSPNGLGLNEPTGLNQFEAFVLSCSEKISISHLASTHFDITKGTAAEYSDYNAGQSTKNTVTGPQQKIPDKALQQNIVLTDLNSPAEESNKQESGNVPNYPRLTGFARQYSENKVRVVAEDDWYNEVPTVEHNGVGLKGPSSKTGSTISNARKRKAEKEKAEPMDWDTLRRQIHSKLGTREMSRDAMDSLDYEALRNADVREISDTIKERGMNNMLAERMKDFLNRVVRDHGRIDLEWLRDVQPDKAKDYLLSIRGLGLKSVECVRLLTLHHLAFPVDTNVGRIAVRLGWVPLQPLPESLQLHLLEMYPVLESIQKYLWPRLCKLDQETLYELHYQMITFGKVFCTKREPNCNACPMRAECRHFASAFASARLALPGPEERRIVTSAAPTNVNNKSYNVNINPLPLLSARDSPNREVGLTRNCEPIIEEPASPELPTEVSERDIEDAFYEDPDEIPVIHLNIEQFTTNLQSFMQENMEIQEGDMSRALVALSPEVASIPMPKLKHVSRLRTEHQVYELPDSHPLLKGLDRREPDDPSPYLLAIWTPGETADSIQPPERKCCSQEGGGLCDKKTCFSCNSTREAQTQTVRGTILIPCRTAMRGSFPLNGTYFQVNEVFADHGSSLDPIDVPRSLLWNLPRRTVFFGTSVSTIFKGLSTEDIQFCFWKGFVCVRGFDRETRAPRPLRARLHFPASRTTKKNERRQKE